VLHRVYIDESGNRGRAPGSSDHFVVSAVVVREHEDAKVRAELATSKQTIGVTAGNVLHFRKLTHPRKVKACQDVSNFSIACVTSVIVCKRMLKPFPSGGLSYISQPDPLYLWAVRLLLERVSWFIRDHGGGSSVVTFAHLTRFKAQKLHNYRQALFHSPTNIHWPSFDGHQFRFNHPNQVELLQVADCSASAIFKAVEADQHGITEPRYLSELGPVVYRYPNSAVTSYGLKVYPNSEGKPGGSLVWLRQY
jgi:hypothetical protein